MPSQSLKDIIERYNFAEVSTTPWQDPKASVLPYRGGSKFTVSPQAMSNTYTPVYRYPINLPKPPEPTDDEDSVSDDDDDGEDGKHEISLNFSRTDRSWQEVAPPPIEGDTPTEVEPLPPSDDINVEPTPTEAPDPEEHTQPDGSQEVHDVVPAVDEDIPVDDPSPQDGPDVVSEDHAAPPIDDPNDDQPPRQDAQPSSDSAKQDGNPKPSEEPLTSTETQSSDTIISEEGVPAVTTVTETDTASPAPTEPPGDALDEAPQFVEDKTDEPGDKATADEQPAITSAEAETHASVPGIPQHIFDNAVEDKGKEPLPPAPDPPNNPPEALVNPDSATDQPSEAPVPGSPPVDKKVSFAPGTLEPAPTTRKKKEGSAGDKKKKKKTGGSHAKVAHDDIVAIVNEGAGEPSPDDIVAVIDEGFAQDPSSDTVIIIDEAHLPPVEADMVSFEPTHTVDEPSLDHNPEVDLGDASAVADADDLASPAVNDVPVVQKDEKADDAGALPSESIEEAKTEPEPDDNQVLSPATETPQLNAKSVEPPQEDGNDKSQQTNVKAKVAMFETPPNDALEAKAPLETVPAAVEGPTDTSKEADSPEIGNPDTPDEQPTDAQEVTEAHAVIEEATSLKADDVQNHTDTQEPMSNALGDDNPAEVEAPEAGPEPVAKERVPAETDPPASEDAAHEPTTEATTSDVIEIDEAPAKETELGGGTEENLIPSQPIEGENNVQEPTSTTVATDKSEVPISEPQSGESEQVAEQPEQSRGDDGTAAEDQDEIAETKDTGGGAESSIDNDVAAASLADPAGDAAVLVNDAQEAESGDPILPDSLPGENGITGEEVPAPPEASEPSMTVGADDQNVEAAPEPAVVIAKDEDAKENGPNEALPDADSAVTGVQNPPVAEQDDTAKSAESSAPQPDNEETTGVPQVAADAPALDEPHLESAAPLSPTLSKGSSKRRQEGWRRQHKTSVNASTAVDHVDSKRSHHSSRTDAGAREERRRSRRQSMSTEEAAERRRRRRARKAEEEAARERERAEKEQERKFRQKVEKASIKAAEKAAADEARKLVRQKEDERHRRSRRKDSALVRDGENTYPSTLRRVDSEQTAELPGSPRLHRPAIPKALTSTNGESVTRAGLLVRTSSDGYRVSGESTRRHRRETQPSGSPLLREVADSARGERPRRSHRSTEKARERSDVPYSSQDANVEGNSSRHPSLRDADVTPEEQRDRPYRSRRESERRERRPEVKEKERKSSFFGSFMKAFK